MSGSVRRVRPRKWAATAVVGVMTLAGCANGPAPKTAAPEVSTPTPAFTMPVHKPNLLMITVDDLTSIDMAYMPKTKKLIADTGVTFGQGIAPTPICVPARASLLSGQYAQNHGALTIHGPKGGYPAFKHDNRTIATALHADGYTTLFAGKYLNEYGQHGTRKDIPPGWSQWRATIDPSTYNFFGAKWNINGKIVKPKGYSSNVITRQALAEVASTKRKQPGKPWFQWVNYVAPHFGGPTRQGDPKQLFKGTSAAISVTQPDLRDRGKYSNVPIPKRPDLFPTDTDGFAKGSPARHRFTPQAKKALQIAYDRRIEAARGLDREIAALLAPLRKSGDLARTLVVFSSDNGYSTGYHNFNGKLWHYQESLDIPILMTGPGVPKGRTVQTPFSNADIPASLLAAAGARSQRRLDGISILPWLNAPDQYRVIPVGGWHSNNGNKRLWWGVSVGPWIYAKLGTGSVEVFDRTKDPYEMHNLAHDPAYATTVKQLHRLAKQYRSCAGNTCPKSLYAASKPLQLATL